MSALKRALNRKACKAAERRLRLHALQVSIHRSNALVEQDCSSEAEVDVGVMDNEACGDVGVMLNDKACGGLDDCIDTVPDYFSEGDVQADDADNSDILEGDSIDSEPVDDLEDDLASDSDDGPVFLSDAEKEQFVIDSVREWAQEPGVLSMTKLDHLLHRLSVVFPNMPLTYTTLFACDYDFQISQFPSGGEFWYKGIRANLYSLSLGDYLVKNGQIILDIGIDGLPLKKKHEPVKLWPILGHLVGSVNQPFIIAVYKGSQDPESVDEFLADFVAEVQDLLLNGYTFEGKVFKFVIRFYVLDAVARQFIKCITTHCGYSGCEKCEVW